jgi:hypothetical protein
VVRGATDWPPPSVTRLLARPAIRVVPFTELEAWLARDDASIDAALDTALADVYPNGATPRRWQLTLTLRWLRCPEDWAPRSCTSLSVVLSHTDAAGLDPDEQAMVVNLVQQITAVARDCTSTHRTRCPPTSVTTTTTATATDTHGYLASTCYPSSSG